MSNKKHIATPNVAYLVGYLTMIRGNSRGACGMCDIGVRLNNEAPLRGLRRAPTVKSQVEFV